MDNSQLTEILERVQQQLADLSLASDQRGVQMIEFANASGRLTSSQQGTAQALAELTQATG